MKRELNISGRWALVTGGSSGIGLAVAKELAQSGLRLIVVGRNEGRLAKAKAELMALGAPEVVTLSVDLAAQGGAERLYRECHERGIEVGVLVNNAGAFIKMLWRLPLSVWSRFWRSTLGL